MYNNYMQNNKYTNKQMIMTFQKFKCNSIVTKKLTSILEKGNVC